MALGVRIPTDLESVVWWIMALAAIGLVLVIAVHVLGNLQAKVA